MPQRGAVALEAFEPIGVVPLILEPGEIRASGAEETRTRHVRIEQ